MSDEETVSRILGLPLARIEYLKEEFGMPVSDPEFSTWFVENAQIILDEFKLQDELRMLEITRRHQDALARSGKSAAVPSGVSVPASYDN